MLAELTRLVASGQFLAPPQIADAVSALASPDAPLEEKADLLLALARRGESPSEIASFARTLRDRSIIPPIPEPLRQRGIIDVCGTGGDGQNTFNISTTVALVVSAAGIPVAKHGNRAVTSRSGSADVLEALRIPVNLSPTDAASALQQHHFAFFFAPHFHPAFRHIAPARKLCAERGHRTVFNFLGPLLNPARPSAQLLGVAHPALCEPLAHVLRELGLHRALVVCGRAGDGYLDEFSTVGETTIAEFHHQQGFSVSQCAPEDLGIPRAQIHDLAGGDRDHNAQLIHHLLSGTDRGPKRNALLLNAGAALFVANHVRSITAGIEAAADLIDSGRALAQLQRLQTPTSPA